MSDETGVDEYWAALAEFLASSPPGDGLSVAPGSVSQAIPGLTPFGEWDGSQIISRVIVHKGLIDEMPNGLLEGVFGTARASFANGVFVVYEIAPTRDEHVRAAELALAEKARRGAPRVARFARGPDIMPACRKEADPAFVGVSELDEYLPFEEQFRRFFQPRLGKRADGFAAIFQALTGHPRPLIIETGCLRTPDNWEGDGQSSFMFDALARDRRGQFLSIDISVENVATARRACSSAANFLCNDSVAALHALSQIVRGPASLVYLDSFDLDSANPLPSAIHHAMELTAARPLLGPGTIVCVDDYCVGGGTGGKGLIVDMFFTSIRSDVLHCGYQKVWCLP
jgi:hypothetical protein